ncbi:MAG: ABC transporter ATP-binding protein [Alphaproteobacteria bacterium]|nr:ABC transporter ATP-binding protein [Alphaproteobacteria bacterium]
MTEPLLRLDGLSVSYRTRRGAVPAVVDVSLALKRGESLGLVGESGCGKSTIAFAIMRWLAGRGQIAGGRVLFEGRDMAEMSREELRRIRGKRIAMVFQEAMSALNPCLTVGAQLTEVLRFHEDIVGHEAERRSKDMLAEVRIPDPDRVFRAFPHEISGGQQQRVVIAMALLANPAVLLLDEPTTGLDVTVEASVVRLIAEISRRFGTALLYISHNLALISRVCERIAVMYAGEIVEEGPTRRILTAPIHPYTRGLISCLPESGADKIARPLSPIPGQIPAPWERASGCFFQPRCGFAVDGLCNTSHPPLVTDGKGSTVRCLRADEIGADRIVAAASEALAPGEGIAVTVDQLSKDYRLTPPGFRGLLPFAEPLRIRANDHLTFNADQGRTLAIVGESGCGKSTFARVLTGLERATGGRLEVAGQDIARLSVIDRSRDQLRALQMVFQNPDETLNPSYKVGRQIARVASRLLNLGRKERAQRVRDLFAEIRLPAGIADRKPRHLSGGQKQRIAIARAFVGRPDIVVADEPVSALDVSVRAAVTQLLMEIQRTNGTTLILISHDLALVRYVADTVVVMYLGQVMEAGTTSQVFSAPHHPYTEVLLAAQPKLEGDRGLDAPVEGETPSPLDPPKGCPFHTRCPRKFGAICETTRPPEQVTPAGHRMACHIPMDELARVQEKVTT